MRSLSRRAFISGVASIPFAVWFQKYALAQASLVRYDVSSQQGQQMLSTYSNVVTKMMNNTSDGDPFSWVFQWYTHAVRASTTKAAEIARIYTNPSDPHRTLAQDMWDTCQAHFPSGNENYFLPWHRMYVFYFERIVREISGDASFTLPYWNYSTAGPTSHGILPAQFRTPPTASNSLYRSNRNSTANQGQAIDTNAPGALDLEALGEPIYESQGAIQGFCMGLDSGLHGNVHVLVGNTQNMGRVPWAARDPIFWMHHCNIDRLWVSWNKNGGQNPSGTWTTGTFVFVDEKGNRVQATVKDFVDINQLGYSYDRLEPAPANFNPITERLEAAKPSVVVARVRGDVALGSKPTNTTLESPSTGEESSISLTDRVAELASAQQLYLVFRNLQSDAQPGILYHIYMDLPTDAKPSKDSSHYVGTFNFFDAETHTGHNGNEETKGPRKFVSFNITRTAKDLLTKGLLKKTPKVTIVPLGKPIAKAKPLVGEISLVVQ